MGVGLFPAPVNGASPLAIFPQSRDSKAGTGAYDGRVAKKRSRTAATSAALVGRSVRWLLGPHQQLRGKKKGKSKDGGRHQDGGKLSSGEVDQPWAHGVLRVVELVFKSTAGNKPGILLGRRVCCGLHTHAARAGKLG